MKNKLFTLTLLFGFMNAQSNLALEGALVAVSAIVVNAYYPSVTETAVPVMAGLFTKRNLLALTPMIKRNLPFALAILSQIEFAKSDMSSLLNNNTSMSPELSKLAAMLIVSATIFGVGKLANYVGSSLENNSSKLSQLSGPSLRVIGKSAEFLSLFQVGFSLIPISV